MSNNIEYDTLTVSDSSGSSPNTLIAFANDENIDISILQRLNPYYDAKEILPPGTEILRGVGSMTQKKDGFVTNEYMVLQNSKGEIYGRYVENVSWNNPNGIQSADEPLKFAYSYNGVTYSSLTLTNLPKMHPELELDTLLQLNPSIGQDAVIKVGGTILLSVYAPGAGTTVKINEFGIMVDTTRTLYISWEWDTKANNKTKNYELEWQWKATNGVWISSGKTSTPDADTKQATYSPDEKAIAVRVRVKPATSTGVTLFGTKEEYQWTDWQEHSFGYTTVNTPPTPSVEIKNYKLTATLDGISNEANNIHNVEFEIIQDNKPNPYKTSGLLNISTGYVSYVCNIDAGHNYKVRARCYNAIWNVYSAWSDYSSVSNTLPTAPKLYNGNVLGNNVVEFYWDKIFSADSYELQLLVKDPDVYKKYNSPEEYFDSMTSGITTIPVDAANLIDDGAVIWYKVPNIAFAEYFVRVRAVNATASKWSNIIGVILGEEPESPTTWSSTTTAAVGEPLKLYWIHNSKDGSRETYAQVKLTVDGVEKPVITVAKSTDEDKKNETSYYEIDTDLYTEGSTIVWQVRTAGILTHQNGEYVFGDWSIERTVDVYAPPTLQVQVLDYKQNIIDGRLETFPFYILLMAGNTNNQTPVGYYVSVIAENDYKTVDQLGNEVAVVAGSKVFSKYYDYRVPKPEPIELTPKDLSLEISQTYSVVCSVAMSSGLTAEAKTTPFYVAWSSKTHVPNAEVGLDKDTLSAVIRPFCLGAGTDEVTLHVYRREFDGTFTPIIEEGDDPNDGLENTGQTFVTDPHPALDYARYRIVARDKSTGAISYNDIPGYPVNEKSVVIQWDETWQSFDVIDEDYTVENPWKGSMIKIPYNIDISNSHSPDVSLVRYIGRKRPVSYYGTQLGESATWNMVIPKSDKETLYALRRLAVYMGNVYVREPSGSGYWANINISFSQKHLDVTIPVTINVTPVEGGM